MSGFRKDHRAERCRWQEHHLAIPKMRRKVACYIGLREGRRWAQDQFGVADGFGHVGRHQGQLHVVPAVRVLEDDSGARRAMLCDLCGIAPPQSDVMALQRKIARGRKRAIAAPEHRDLQMASPCEDFGASSCLSMKCCTLPKAVRGKSSTKTISRGTLKRASCVSTCAFKFSASTKHPARLIT